MKKLTGFIAVSLIVLGINGVIFAELEKIVFAGAIPSEKHLAQFFPNSSSPFKRMRYKKRSARRSKQEPTVRNLDYKKLLLELQYLKSIGDMEAFGLVPHFDVLVNWHLGEKIDAHMAKHDEKPEQELKLIEQLAVDLANDKKNLISIIRFYRLYQDVSGVSTTLSWAHYVELVKITDGKKRQHFQKRAVRKKWSAGELKKQVQSSQ